MSGGRSASGATCASHGHLWGPSGKCIMCGTRRPEGLADPVASPRLAFRDVLLFDAVQQSHGCTRVCAYEPNCACWAEFVADRDAANAE